MLQGVQDARPLRGVGGVRGHAGLRRPHHGVGGHLARQVGAEAHGLELEDLGRHVLRHVAVLEVAAAHPALAQEALGAGVETEQRDIPQILLVEHLGERGEAVPREVDVLLVDLVGQHGEAVGLGELEDHADVVLIQHGSGGIARVDDAEGLHAGALGLRLSQGLLQHGAVELPALGLVQVVGHHAALVEGDGGGIERVLGDGDHDPVLRPGDEEAQDGLHALAGAVREEDGIGVHPHVVAFEDELGHRLPDEAHAPALAVGPQAVLRAGEDGSGRLHHVHREGPGGGGHQLRVLAEREDLPVPGEGPLTQGLGVPDVAVDDLPPLLFQFLGAGHDGAPDGVLRLQDGPAEILQLHGHGSS